MEGGAIQYESPNLVRRHVKTFMLEQVAGEPLVEQE